MNKLNQTRRTANCFHFFLYFHPSSEAQRINDNTEGMQTCVTVPRRTCLTQWEFLYQQEIPEVFPASCALQIPSFIEFWQKLYLKQGYNYCRQTRVSALRPKHVVPFWQIQHSSRNISADDMRGSYSDALPGKQDCKLRLAWRSVRHYACFRLQRLCR
jgi:hypothetical protein